MAKDKIHNTNDYKPSAIGRIPKDWDALKIKDFASINNSTINESNSKNFSFYYLDLSSVKQGKVSFPKNKISFTESPSRARRKLKQNNIIMATVRPNLLGFAIANFPTDDFVCSTGFALIEADHLYESQFIYQNLYSKSLNNQIENLVVGSSYPAINNSDVENLILPYPKLKEERYKIGQILTTWDSSIETLENLIKRKERRKKALMQQLLTGKKRFKEFKEKKLKEFTLSQIAKLVRGPFGGALKKEIFVDKGYKVYEQRNAIYNNFGLGSYYITEEKYKELIRFKVESGDVIMSCSGTAGKFAIAPINTEPGIINQALLKITVNPNLLINDYFKQFVKSPVFNSQLFMDFAGGAIKNIGSVGSLSKIILKVPSIQEQEKVASVLSAADKEIQLLKTQLEHHRRQKKGLMQVLLTGKKRIKV